MINFRDKVVDVLSSKIDNFDVEKISSLIETPPDPKMGDYAFPVFSLAPIYKKNPNEIASDLVEELDSTYFDKIQAQGPYINFFIDENILKAEVFDNIAKDPERFGASSKGEGLNVVVDFSSPNIAKPFHIGHLRSTVIGNSIRNIYGFLGYNTIAVNHLGDYGTQFGLLLTAYTKWGDEEAVRENPIPELLKLYVEINERIDQGDEDLKEESRAWFRKLEAGDDEAISLWEFFREESLKEFYRVYDMLGIEFDSHNGESFYSDKMDKVIEDLRDKDLLVESEDSLIVDLEDYNIPPMLITKSDGSTLYSTRDLAAAQYRYQTYDFYKNIYVVGSQQKLHFDQLFKVLELMDKPYYKDMVHVSFGMVSLPGGTMSTRRGNVVFLEDVLNESIQKSLKIIEDRDIEDKEELASQIGIGAIIFQELFNDRNKDYVFDWDEILSFEGETGPYVQYTHARISSLLANGGFDKEKSFNYELLDSEEEINLIKHMYKFSDVIVRSASNYQPFQITRYITELAKMYNSYYANTSINVEDEDLKEARQGLSYSVKVIIKNGLGLLGIQAPEKM